MKEFSYVIKDEIGIHARPAGLLAKEAKKYKSTILLSKGDKEAEATKLMSIMGLGVKCKETVKITVVGPDEYEACEDMKLFFEENL